VGLTGDDSADAAHQFIKAGADEVMIKPVNIKRLNVLLSRLSSQQP